MAIVRNKKPQAADPSAIAAFGAAADATPESAVPATPDRTPRKAQQGETKAPASSLVRWEKHAQLRDDLMAFAKEQRYPVHTVLLMALELGLEQLQKRNQ